MGTTETVLELKRWARGLTARVDALETLVLDLEKKLEAGEEPEDEDETDEDEPAYTNLVLHDAICESRDDIVDRVERRADRIGGAFGN